MSASGPGVRARARSVGAACLLAVASSAGATGAASAAGAAGAAGAATTGFPVAAAHEPRAFGWRVGDVVTRTVLIDVPADLRLDASSLPRTGRRGGALELRGVAWRGAGGWQHGPGRRHELTLRYQVFASPAEPREFELAPVTLRFDGRARPESVRIDAWPVVVSPLAPVEVSPRQGLGAMRPDAPAALIDDLALRLRLTGYGVVAALLAGWLLLARFGLPWRAARERPFARAWRALRGATSAGAARGQRTPPEPLHEAFRPMHEALNRTAGWTVFERDLDRFLAQQPRFAPLRAELALFLRRSREAFFAEASRPDAMGRPDETDQAAGGIAPAGNQARDPADLQWLRELCRRCRDIERGAA